MTTNYPMDNDNFLSNKYTTFTVKQPKIPSKVAYRNKSIFKEYGTTVFCASCPVCCVYNHSLIILQQSNVLVCLTPLSACLQIKPLLLFNSSKIVYRFMLEIRDFFHLRLFRLFFHCCRSFWLKPVHVVPLLSFSLFYL